MSVEEFAPLEREFNITSLSLQRDWRAFEVLGEVDRALLAANEIDRALDIVLPKFRELTRSQCVGVILHGSDRARARPPVHGGARRRRAAGATRDLRPRDDRDGTRDAGRHDHRAHRGDAACLPRVDARCRRRILLALAGGRRRAAELPCSSWDTTASRRAIPPWPTTARRSPSGCAPRLSNSARDERLYRQAHYDPLTQLPNRALFRDRLAQELAAAATGLTRGALMYVDLDHFKRVNDTLGHSAGDQLLSIVAHRLKACTKEGDTVARLGGDEFTVLLRNVGDVETVRQIAERVIRSLALPANLGGRDYQMRASVGVTLFPDDGVRSRRRDPPRGSRDVSRQGAGTRPRDLLRARNGAAARELHGFRPAPRVAPARAVAVLPAAVHAGRQPPVRRRGAAALADALRRHQTTRRVHSRRRTLRAHHRHRRVRAGFGVLAVRGVGARRHRAAHVLGQRLGAAAQGQQLRAHGAVRARAVPHHARPASSSSWSNPCSRTPRWKSRCAPSPRWA